MTLLGYFNSLRGLGGSRRIIEDEVYMKAKSRWRRHRLEPAEQLFRSRDIGRTPVELTSRVSTNDVADARRKLALGVTQSRHIGHARSGGRNFADYLTKAEPIRSLSSAHTLPMVLLTIGAVIFGLFLCLFLDLARTAGGQFLNQVKL